MSPCPVYVCVTGRMTAIGTRVSQINCACFVCGSVIWRVFDYSMTATVQQVCEIVLLRCEQCCHSSQVTRGELSSLAHARCRVLSTSNFVYMPLQTEISWLVVVPKKPNQILDSSRHSEQLLTFNKCEIENRANMHTDSREIFHIKKYVGLKRLSWYIYTYIYLLVWLARQPTTMCFHGALLGTFRECQHILHRNI